ncbi:MAG: M20/M25/M40 family metallo-hydrolase [Planctomyces sp.]|jgi:tripeptide aminopeptidase
MLNEAAAIQRVTKLISIPGISGKELLVSEFIREQLREAGVPASAFETDTAHHRSPAGGETGNLIVRLKGTKRSPRRLLMAHMDTVPLAEGCQPVSDGEWIRPKQSTTALGGDNRAGCAVVLTAVLEILQQKLDHPPLTLLFTVQEETGLRGARFLKPEGLGNPTLCFNWDGRSPGDLIVGAVGANNLRIVIDGIASHAGVHPEEGVNALVVASMAIADLQNNGWHGLVVQQKQRGTSNIGIIQGGDATNVVMPRVTIHAEARSHKASFCRKIVSEYRKAFQRALSKVRSSAGHQASLSFEEDLRYNAFRIPPRSACVAAAVSAAETLGIPCQTVTSNGGLDANWMTEHGFPTVTMGCGQHRIHTVDEVLSIPEFLTACRIGLHLATDCTAR